MGLSAALYMSFPTISIMILWLRGRSCLYFLLLGFESVEVHTCQWKALAAFSHGWQQNRWEIRADIRTQHECLVLSGQHWAEWCFADMIAFSLWIQRLTETKGNLSARLLHCSHKFLGLLRYWSGLDWYLKLKCSFDVSFINALTLCC